MKIVSRLRFFQALLRTYRFLLMICERFGFRNVVVISSFRSFHAWHDESASIATLYSSKAFFPLLVDCALDPLTASAGDSDLLKSFSVRVLDFFSLSFGFCCI